MEKNDDKSSILALNLKKHYKEIAIVATISKEEMDALSVNCIRKLGIDQIQHANSGHPGIVLGAAPIIYAIFSQFLHFNTNDPNWKGRDRFVLSAGHGSALLYATLFYFGFFVTINDLKKFRQLDSATPGHPRYWSIPGIETTTGPLGQGIANGVGMAFSEKWLNLNVQFESENNGDSETTTVFDNYTYVICSDGCLQEGISYEAMSFAGHYQLNKLILLYDSNKIQLDGPTKETFSENIKQRVEGSGWEYFLVADGSVAHNISNAIDAAQSSSSPKPKFIEVKTIIGVFSPLANSPKVHGAPFSQSEYAATVANLGFPKSDNPFSINYEVLQKLSAALKKRTNPKYGDFEKKLEKLITTNKSLYDQFIHRETTCIYNELLKHSTANATGYCASRDFVGEMINYLGEINLNMIGGSADLASSTRIKGADGIFGPGNKKGREIKFGVRENAMVAIITGINLYGCQNSYGATFLAFFDNAKLATRLAAMIQARTLVIYSHDSIFLGEDGETHQPIEQLGNLRSIPHLITWRPFNREEAAAALEFCYSSDADSHANVIITSRQKYYQVSGYEAKVNIQKGGYVIRFETVHAAPVIILFASGSDVEIALRVAQMLESLKVSTRVISVPCLTRLLAPKNISYLLEITFKLKPQAFVIEAGNCSLWYRLIARDLIKKNYFNMTDFGMSGKGENIAKSLHFTAIEIFQEVWKSHQNKDATTEQLNKAIIVNQGLFAVAPQVTVENQIVVRETKKRKFLHHFLHLFNKSHAAQKESEKSAHPDPITKTSASPTITDKLVPKQQQEETLKKDKKKAKQGRWWKFTKGLLIRPRKKK